MASAHAVSLGARPASGLQRSANLSSQHLTGVPLVNLSDSVARLGQSGSLTVDATAVAGEAWTRRYAPRRGHHAGTASARPREPSCCRSSCGACLRRCRTPVVSQRADPLLQQRLHRQWATGRWLGPGGVLLGDRSLGAVGRIPSARGRHWRWRRPPRSPAASASVVGVRRRHNSRGSSPCHRGLAVRGLPGPVTRGYLIRHTSVRQAARARAFRRGSPAVATG
jgi:hypothetical protein